MRRVLVVSLVIGLCGPRIVRAQHVWVQQGPGPTTKGQVEGITDREVVGAIHTVATHPTDPNIVYVGAVNGGIWRTVNASAARPTWVEQLALDQALSIGAIAFDPTDATNQTLLAGAGRFSSFLGLGSDRVGVWRTTDGGANWLFANGAAPAGLPSGINISGVAPRGATLVVSSNAASAPGAPGVWRSVDGGATWTRISGGAGTGLPAGSSFDLASDPSNNSQLFTNAGANGIYRSSDLGATWTRVSNATMNGILAGGVGNVKISVGASNNVFVAIVTGGRLAGLFRSGDGGGTWSSLDLPTTTESGTVFGIHPGGQGGTHLSIAADRADANVVYIGGDRQPSATEAAGTTTFPNSIGANDYSGRLFRVDASQPAGSQAVHITHSNTAGKSAPHADSRHMAIDANGDLIEVDDGGIYRRTSPRTNTGDWFSVNGDLKVTELHSIAWDANAKIVIGGAQDTGTPEELQPNNAKWQDVVEGDGGTVAVDDHGTAGVSIRYSSNASFLNFWRRSFDAANTLTAFVAPALTVVGGGNPFVAQFYTPIAVNNVTPTRLVIGGGNSVYESSDQGSTLTEIGPGIVANDCSVRFADDCGRHPIAYGAAGNADMLYVGSGDRVFIRNAAPPAVLTSSAAYPGIGTGRQVVDIAIHPNDPQSAFVLDPTHVYRTTDAGSTWTDITGDLLTHAPGALLSIAFSTSNTDGSVVVGANNGVFIARGPTFTTWAVLGSGLPRAPVYDLDYDGTDEILAAGLLGRGAWTISMTERKPVDVALVLDLSGSMLDPACATCAAKLDVLKDAVELFTQLWTVFSIPEDRFGVDYFRTNISEFTVGGNALFPAQANAAAVVADVRGQTTVPQAFTAMGGGIQTAINRLTDATRFRNIILFTDGMQNVNPMVNNATFNIENQTGYQNSNVNPTTPATQLNTALHVKVNTIGVGATPAFVTLLDDIATQTNGVFKATTAPDAELRRFYIENLIDVLRTSSPQLVGYRYGTVTGDSTAEVFTTDAAARRVALKLSWQRGNSLGFSVRKDGADVTRLGRTIRGAFYSIWTIDVPTTAFGHPLTAGGDWQLQIHGKPGITYEAAAIVEEEELGYRFAIGGMNHLAGSPLPLSVQLTFGGQPVTDAQVTARVLTPQQGLGTLLATTPMPPTPAGFQAEPAATPGQRKYQLLLRQTQFQAALKPLDNGITFQNAGNGTYSASFANTQASGTYTAIFRVRGQRADIGSYDRTEIRSVTVRFATPALAASSVRWTAAGSTAAGRKYELTIRPVDGAGNYLGPDYAGGISVLVDGVRVSDSPVDKLDGSYVFSVVSSRPPPNVTIVITVLGRPLYNGPLSGIPSGGSGGGGSKLWLSAHGGAAIPVTGFPAAASTGLLLEADLEYRVTPRFSLEGVVGRYDFGSSPEIVGGTLYAMAYGSGSPWRVFAGVGPGVYKPKGTSSSFGVSGALGVNTRLSSHLEAELGASYTHITRSGSIGFLGLKAGLKVGL
jgi:hypothetical protein